MQMRDALLWMSALAVAVVAVVAVPQVQAQPKAVKFTKQWKGSVANAALMQGAPEVITNAKALDKLWKLWAIQEKVPEVDFTKELVVLGVTSGSRINLSARLDDNGNLDVLGMATLDFGEGFRYVIATVSRAGVKTVNKKALPNQPLPEEEAAKLAVEAYIYGYPLVTMEMTRRVLTAAGNPKAPRAPMGQFNHARTYPTPNSKAVTAPNADTLYSSAWVDLSKEPYVLSLPDQKDRYYMVCMMSGWTDVFAAPGTRTTGDKAQKHAITGPDWKGQLPEGVAQIKSPTNMVWILGRTYSSGTPEDFKAVHALQDQYQFVPLSAYGKPYTPPPAKLDPTIDVKTPTRNQVHALDAGAFFKLLATLLKGNPPAAADAAMVAKLAKLGIEAGKEFDIAKLDPAAAKALQQAPKAALEKMQAHVKNRAKPVNGWNYSPHHGVYGTDYLNRATVAMVGLGANLSEDTIYPVSGVDADGKPLSGANKYVLHFDKGMTPPVKGFWSMTMYDTEYFFVANPLNRYTVSPRNDLKHNADGSLDLYIQNESPGKDKESNWLPAPKGEFILMIRMYWPNEMSPSILGGTWEPPPPKKIAGK